MTESWRWHVYEETRGEGLRSITESADGKVIWFGTRKGILRYDGYAWTRYDEIQTSIGAPVNVICTGAKGTLYAASDNGIASFRDGKWVRLFPLDQQIPITVNNIRPLSGGGLLISSSWGAIFYDGKAFSIWTTEEPARLLDELLEDVTIHVLPEGVAPKLPWDSGVGIWGSWGEFLGAKRGNSPVMVWAVKPGSPADRASIEPGDLLRMIDVQPINPKDALFGEEGIAIKLFVRKRKWAETRSVQMVRRELEGQLPNFQVSDALVARDGSLWFGLQEGQVLQFRPGSVTEPLATGPDDGEWILHRRDGQTTASLAPRFLETASGEIWVISNDRLTGHGVAQFDGVNWNHFDLETIPKGSNNNTSIIQTKNGDIYVGGFKLYRFQNNQWKIYTIRDLPIPFHRTRLYQRSNGEFWIIGLDQHATSVDLSSRLWKSYSGLSYVAMLPGTRPVFVSEDQSIVIRNSEEDWIRFELADIHVTHIKQAYATRKGGLWVLGRDAEGVITSYLAPGAKKWVYTVHNAMQVGSPRANGLFEANDGSMWFGTQQGVLHYKEGSWYYHSPPEAPAQVYAIAQTGEGTLWFGGDHLRKLENGQWSPVVTEPGLNSWIETLYFDGDYLWVGTRSYGVYQYDGETWRNWTVDDGLSDNNVHKIIQRKDGNILAKTERGISLFDGNHWFALNLPIEKTAEPYLSEISETKEGGIIFNYDILYTLFHQPERYPPDTFIGEIPESVPHPGSVTIQWSGVDAWEHTPPDLLNYAWSLDGETWSEFRTSTSKSFFELPSGKNTFYVKSRDTDLNEDPTPAQIQFYVEKPIYAQAWFILLIGTLLVVIVLQSVRLYRKKKNLEQARDILEERVAQRTGELRDTVTKLEAEVKERRRVEQDLLRALEEVKAASQAKSEFLAVVGHEIRTPLNAILGFAQVLPETVDEQERREFVNVIIDRGQHLLAMISDILEFTNLSSRSPHIREDKINPLELLKSIVKAQQSSVDVKGIFLNVQANPTLVPELIVSDRQRLHQILENLIGNAIKFTSSGGVTVTLEAEETADYSRYILRFEVLDTGIGIEPDKLQAIFDPLYQVDSSLSRTFDGIGLGLAISKRHAEILGGSLICESQPGKGSCFTLTIAVSLPDDDETDQTDRKPPSSTLSKSAENTGAFLDSGLPKLPGARIVLLEDDPLNQRIIQLLLTRSGHTVTCLRQSDDLKQTLSGDHCDLLLLDLQMEEVDGLETTRAIRGGEWGNGLTRVPVVGISEPSSQTDRASLFDAGMNAILLKPVKAAELNQLLSRLLAEKRQNDWLAKSKMDGSNATSSYPLDEDETGAVNGSTPNSDDS